MIASCHFLRRHLLHLVEFGRANESLVLINKMWVDIAFLLVSFVYDSHIARNFAFDALVRFALHLSLLLNFLCSFLDVVDGAADDFSLLIFLDMLIDESLLIAGS